METKQVRIRENWLEIEKLEKLAQEKTGDKDAGFNADLFFLSGVRNLIISIKYNKTIRGKKTQKYYELDVCAKYCPFTGKPLFEKQLKI